MSDWLLARRGHKAGVATDTVLLQRRTWDGIDRPEYTTISRLTPGEARALAQELFSVAESIDGKSKKDRTTSIIRRNTEKIVKAAKKEALG